MQIEAVRLNHHGRRYTFETSKGEIMRRLVDLTDEQLKALDQLAETQKRSRAAVIRQAVDEYIAKNASLSFEDAFGLWAGKKIDGLTYERKLRSEW